MRSIRDLAGYYYLCLAIGLCNKEAIIEWADSIIANDTYPYELIEVSLSRERTLNEVLSILKEIYGKYDIDAPLSKLLGLLVIKLETGKITEDKFFGYISSLLLQGSAFTISEEVLHMLDRLDDSYYLAFQGIYGSVEQIRNEAINDLWKYKDCVSLFEEA